MSNLRVGSMFVSNTFSFSILNFINKKKIESFFGIKKVYLV